MEYDPIRHAFICKFCGPGLNRYKNIFSQVLVDEETGCCYCIVHQDNKIGEQGMVEEWKNNGTGQT